MIIYWTIDYQQRYKAILEAAMVSIPDRFTENSPMPPSQSMTVNNPNARKLLRQLLDALNVKPKTAVRRFCAAKSKHTAIRADS